jgi:hypothetical protein
MKITMRKQKDDPFPRHEFADRLDQLLIAAERAGLSDLAIASALQSRAESRRQRQAFAGPVEAARMPSTTIVGGPGNVLQRTIAAIRGE